MTRKLTMSVWPGAEYASPSDQWSSRPSDCPGCAQLRAELAARRRANPHEIPCGCLLCERHLDAHIVAAENRHFGIEEEEES